VLFLFCVEQDRKVRPTPPELVITPVCRVNVQFRRTNSNLVEYLALFVEQTLFS